MKLETNCEGRENMSKVETIYGITYKNPEEAKKAQKEWEGIQFILSKNDMENIETVLSVYNKLMERGILKTEVGKKFLKELKERLLEAEEVENKKIYGFNEEDEKWLKRRKAQKDREEEEKAKQKARKEERQKKDYRQKYYHALILNFLLVAAILIMAYITLNSNHVNILNYENALLDKYASWEESLKSKEADLNTRERELAKKEAQQ